jgi:hypothetical protein
VVRSALSEVGLPQSPIPAALLLFNIGVEIGQLLFITSVFAVIAFARQVTQRIGVSQPALHGAFLPMPSVAFRHSGASRCFEVAAMTMSTKFCAARSRLICPSSSQPSSI